jgi:hypothetical protein
MRALAVLATLALVAAACNQLLGGGEVRLGDGGGTGTDAPKDGGIDARPADAPPGCTPDNTRPDCSDCIDNDADGQIDSADTECTTPGDDDEGSFGTAIPGDNGDPVQQDCFFDGNSGGGDDGCQIHVCCILGVPNAAQCPISPVTYNPNNCPPPIGTRALPSTCVGGCGSKAPLGCDCWGCCTVCEPTVGTCVDILIHPETSPTCDATTVTDPMRCTRCVKSAQCGRPCGGCVLCPGQTVSMLPAACGGVPTCPAGISSCAAASCPNGTYCDESSKCCIGA